MVKCIQIVMGPAGSGKSTYCSTIHDHCNSIGRRVFVANLDPAAEHFDYEVAFNVQDLISVEEVMDELGLGPNGGLVYCMEYLLSNTSWLEDQLSTFGDDDYLILDCPGQIELYTHVPIMRRLIDRIRQWNWMMCGVFVVDATFCCDMTKFISGSLLSLSAMCQMELPHINIMSKCDLMDEEELDKVLDMGSASEVPLSGGNPRLNNLTRSICELIDDYSQVSFLPLNIHEEDTIDVILSAADHCMQFGEDSDVRIAEDEAFEARGDEY